MSTPPPLPRYSQPAPARSGCLHAFLITGGVILGLSVVLTIIGLVTQPSTLTTTSRARTNSAPAATPERRTEGRKKTYATGEQFVVGYTRYEVHGSWYSKHLSSNEFLDRPPDAAYLFVEISVWNEDKKQRTIPPFKLLDDSNAEYGTSDKAWMTEGSIGILDNLNPGVGKRAYVIFDVPPTNKYRLLVRGGFWSASDALVELSPRPKKK